MANLVWFAIPLLSGTAVYRWGPHRDDTDAQGALAVGVGCGATLLMALGAIFS